MKSAGPHENTSNPRSAKEAHDHMVGLLNAALSDDRSAIVVTMKPLPGKFIDVKTGMMNLDQHRNGLFMLAFALAKMNERSGSDIKDDMFTFGEFVGRLLE